MAATATHDWDVGEKSGLVSIGTHNLYISVSGPDRKPEEPVIVLMPGVTSTISEWPVAIRSISQFARLASYDRSGYGKSEVSPNRPTPTTIAAELNALLQAADIRPPYITLGHSWGGVLTMEFLASRPSPKDIVGMVFVDATGPTYFSEITMGWEDPAILAVQKDVDYVAVTGVDKQHALSNDEWQAFLDEDNSEKHGLQAVLEMKELGPGYPVLQAKKLIEQRPPILGDGPICVVHGHSDREQKTMYEAGVAMGNGTEEQRETVRRYCEVREELDVKAQKKFLEMSTKGHWIEADWCGHNVQLQEPEKIVEGVRWVVENLVR